MKNIFTIMLSTIAITSAYANTNPEIAIIDAGSSGTRLHVYQENNNKLESVYESSNKDPISGFIYNTNQAAKPIEDLLNTASASVTNIHSIPIYVYATAGMRYVPTMQQNEIYQNVTSTLKTDGYNVIQAKTISGEDEGLFDWISVNYLNDDLGTQKTSGALDLGGASTQIAFTVDTPSVANKNFTYNGIRYNIYSKSFLGLGLDKATSGISSTLKAKQYCFPESYWSTELTDGVESAYNNIECKQSANKYVRKNFNGIYNISNVLRNSTAESYVAFSGFYYTSSFFGINGESNISDINTKTNAICDVTWNDFVGNFGFNKYSANECLNSNYLQSLLTNYGFAKTLPINFEDSINGQSVDWSIGAALYILNNDA